jgi:glycosyltransferase involved in cell wall biosynthesis
MGRGKSFKRRKDTLMRIVQRCDYRFPAYGSAGAERLVESLCKGLRSLGHEVVLWSKPGSKLDFVECVEDFPKDFDIIHHHGWTPQLEGEYNSWGIPWVSTIHGGGMENDPYWLQQANNNPNIVCVSKFVADRINCKAFVHSCVDQDEFRFQEQKQDYFLYLSGLDWGFSKGLDTFIMISKLVRSKKFIIAGSGKNEQIINFVRDQCKDSSNLKFVGEVNGQFKIDLISSAKALIMPTKLPDACPLTVPESLMCGTPVIGSTNGSLPELLNKKIGFNCETMPQYMKAMLIIDKIKPIDCRKEAEERFSSVAAAKKYISLYEKRLKYGSVQV